MHPRTGQSDVPPWAADPMSLSLCTSRAIPSPPARPSGHGRRSRIADSPVVPDGSVTARAMTADRITSTFVRDGNLVSTSGDRPRGRGRRHGDPPSRRGRQAVRGEAEGTRRLRVPYGPGRAGSRARDHPTTAPGPSGARRGERRDRGSAARTLGRTSTVDRGSAGAAPRTLHGGIPMYSVFVAVALDGEPAVGVVASGSTGERWWAARGTRAYKNGRPIQVIGSARRSKRSSEAGFPFQPAADLAGTTSASSSVCSGPRPASAAAARRPSTSRTWRRDPWTPSGKRL